MRLRVMDVHAPFGHRETVPTLVILSQGQSRWKTVAVERRPPNGAADTEITTEDDVPWQAFGGD
jgi:hypothetical protein